MTARAASSTLVRLGLCLGALAVGLPSCASEHDVVVGLAQSSSAPWTCGSADTEVDHVSMDRYRLVGCGKAALYQCSFQEPSRCWMPRWGP